MRNLVALNYSEAYWCAGMMTAPKECDEKAVVDRWAWDYGLNQ